MFYRRMPIEAESPEERGYASLACNLSESSVADVKLETLLAGSGSLVLAYGDHRGLPELRRLIAAGVPGLHESNVLLTPGAAAALFIIHTALLKKGDHLIVVHPNYATNLETPFAIGCEISRIGLRFEENFQLDPERIRAALRPETKLISITSPHNPTGMIIPPATIAALADMARENGCRLLVDETYAELVSGTPAVSAAALGEHVVAVSSVSKAYGLPGLRLGWLLSQDEQLLETLLAAKEQILICNSVLDETLVCEVMRKKTEWLGRSLQHIRQHRQIVLDWCAGMSGVLELVPPQGGVVCLPRIRTEINVDPQAFYNMLLDEYKTLVGPGHWFGLDDRYFRIGYGWPGEAELRQGLGNIEKALHRVLDQSK